mmetsp:Transcript_8395/g.21463  ORF Transcript_8395/g.21463 Transcript_8395/m.21463 type:complete len:487 (-) Transcript_8395:291-1751(-)
MVLGHDVFFEPLEVRRPEAGEAFRLLLLAFIVRLFVLGLLPVDQMPLLASSLLLELRIPMRLSHLPHAVDLRLKPSFHFFCDPFLALDVNPCAMPLLFHLSAHLRLHRVEDFLHLRQRLVFAFLRLLFLLSFFALLLLLAILVAALCLFPALLRFLNLGRLPLSPAYSLRDLALVEICPSGLFFRLLRGLPLQCALQLLLEDGRARHGALLEEFLVSFSAKFFCTLVVGLAAQKLRQPFILALGDALVDSLPNIQPLDLHFVLPLELLFGCLRLLLLDLRSLSLCLPDREGLLGVELLPTQTQLCELVLVLFFGPLLLHFDGLKTYGLPHLERFQLLLLPFFLGLLLLDAIRLFLFDLGGLLLLEAPMLFLENLDVLEESLLAGRAFLGYGLLAPQIQHVHRVAQTLPRLQLHAARRDFPIRLVQWQLRYLVRGFLPHSQLSLIAVHPNDKPLDHIMETARLPVWVHELGIKPEKVVELLVREHLM